MYTARRVHGTKDNSPAKKLMEGSLLTSSDYEMLVVRVRRARPRCQMHDACSAMPRRTRLSCVCERELPRVCVCLRARMRGRHRVCCICCVQSVRQ